jgi:hypothetical protein
VEGYINGAPYLASQSSVTEHQGIKKRMMEGEEERRLQEENARGEQGKGIK